MRLGGNFADRDASSSVLSLVLMVGMVVLLVGVVGAFAFNVPNALEDPGPQADFSSDYDGTVLALTYERGDSIPAADLLVVTSTPVHQVDAAGSPVGPDATEHAFTDLGHAGDVQAGDAVSLAPASGSLDDDDVVRVVYRPPSSDRSTVLYEWQAN